METPVAPKLSLYGKFIRLVFWGITAPLLIGGIILLFWPVHKSLIKSAIQERLESVLVAPSTAKLHITSITDSGHEIFDVQGYVDTQNRMGAIVRLDFSCRATITGGKATLFDWQTTSR